MKLFKYLWIILHTRKLSIYSNKIFQKSSGTYSIPLPNGRLLSNLGCLVGHSDSGVVGESSPCLLLHSTQWVFRMILLLPSPSSCRLLVKREYLSLVLKQHPTPPEDFPRKIQWLPSLIVHNHWYPGRELQLWQEPLSSIQIFLVSWEWLGFRPNDCPKILPCRTTPSSKLPEEFLGAYFRFMDEIFHNQKNSLANVRRQWIPSLDNAKIMLPESRLVMYKTNQKLNV